MCSSCSTIGRYADDLLAMVRELGSPTHRAAQPAFAALAMARRSEFEGRMLAILDRHYDRHPLTRRGALVLTTAVSLLLDLQQPADPAAWRRTINVDLNGMFYCTRRAVPHLKASQGVIINLSSVAGRLGYAYRTPYAAAKWAVVGLTKSLANELGPFGVRVNTTWP